MKDQSDSPCEVGQKNDLKGIQLESSRGRLRKRICKSMIWRTHSWSHLTNFTRLT